jgi:outer membrane immunogenic protein
MTKLYAAAACWLLASGSALAGDLPTRKAAPAPQPLPTPYNWTGVYGGLNVAWAGSTETFNTYRSTTGLLVASGNDNTSGFRGGGQIGYRYQLPSNFVLGASASLDYGQTLSVTYNDPTGSSTLRSSSNLSGDLVAHLGYAFGDVLPYVLGGYTWANSDLSRNQLTGNGAPPSFTEQTNATRSGWTVGGGVGYHIFGNWDVFAQYKYSQFQSVNISFPLAKVHTDSKVWSDAALLGLNYKF